MTVFNNGTAIALLTSEHRRRNRIISVEGFYLRTQEQELIAHSNNNKSFANRRLAITQQVYIKIVT